MSVAMALVAASNTLGEVEWSNMAAINCRWTGVLHTTFRHFKWMNHTWTLAWDDFYTWVPAGFHTRLINESQSVFVCLVSVFTSRPAPPLIHDSLQLRAVTDCEWPSWQLPKVWEVGYKNCICYKYFSVAQQSSTSHWPARPARRHDGPEPCSRTPSSPDPCPPPPPYPCSPPLPLPPDPARPPLCSVRWWQLAGQWNYYAVKIWSVRLYVGNKSTILT